MSSQPAMDNDHNNTTVQETCSKIDIKTNKTSNGMNSPNNNENNEKPLNGNELNPSPEYGGIKLSNKTTASNNKPVFALDAVNEEVSAASNGYTNQNKDAPDCGQVASSEQDSVSSDGSDESVSFGTQHEAHSSGPNIKLSSSKGSFRKSVSRLFSCASGNNDPGDVKSLDNILGQGYLADRKRLKKFFKKKLGYNTFWEGDGFVNVTQKKLLESIENVKLEIQKKASTKKPYDRFVFVVLTHGSENGLQTCANRNGNYGDEELKQIEPGRWQYVHTKVEDICAHFKHDKVPALKGKPKLFLVQACRGSETVKAAGGSNPQPRYDLSKLALEKRFPIDADQIVFYASTPDTKSFVTPNGSWFIQTTLDVFERHHKKMHIEEMFTIVNLVTSNKIAQERISKKRRHTNAL